MKRRHPTPKEPGLWELEQQQINLGYECISFQTSSSSTTTLAYQKKTNFISLLTKSQTKPKQRFNFEQDPKRKPNWRIGQAIKAQLRLLRRANKRNLVGLKSRGMWGMWCIRLGEEHRPPIALRATAPRWAPACWLPSFCFRAASSGGGWSATNCGGTAATDFWAAPKLRALSGSCETWKYTWKVFQIVRRHWLKSNNGFAARYDCWGI